MLVAIAKAKAEGNYKGIAPTARAQAEKVRELKQAVKGLRRSHDNSASAERSSRYSPPQ
jgi:hypothetical protein